jgi:hypothetical protein
MRVITTYAVVKKSTYVTTLGEAVHHRTHTCTAELMIGEAVHHRMNTCTAELMIGETVDRSGLEVIW